MRRIIFSGAVMALSAFSLPMFADAVSDARKGIEGALKKSSIAAAKHDPAGLLATYSPDYVLVTKKGQTMTLAGLRQNVYQLTKAAKSMNIKDTIQKFRLKGNVATVLTKEDAVIVLSNAKTKHDTVIKSVSVTEDIWVKSGGGWLHRRSTQISSQTTMDGQKAQE